MIRSSISSCGRLRKLRCSIHVERMRASSPIRPTLPFFIPSDAIRGMRGAGSASARCRCIGQSRAQRIGPCRDHNKIFVSPGRGHQRCSWPISPGQRRSCWLYSRRFSPSHGRFRVCLSFPAATAERAGLARSPADRINPDLGLWDGQLYLPFSLLLIMLFRCRGDGTEQPVGFAVGTCSEIKCIGA